MSLGFVGLGCQNPGDETFQGACYEECPKPSSNLGFSSPSAAGMTPTSLKRALPRPCYVGVRCCRRARGFLTEIGVWSNSYSEPSGFAVSFSARFQLKQGPMLTGR